MLVVAFSTPGPELGHTVQPKLLSSRDSPSHHAWKAMIREAVSALPLICHQDRTAGNTTEGWRRPVCSGMRKGWFRCEVGWEGTGMGTLGVGRWQFLQSTHLPSLKLSGSETEVPSEGLRSLTSCHPLSPDPP